MHTLTLLATLLFSISSVLAFPRAHFVPQYAQYDNYVPQPVTSTSAVVPTSTPTPAPPLPPSAPPAPSASKTASEVPTARPTAEVYICSDANWSGKCGKVSAPVGMDPQICTTLDGTATSIGPDEGFDCYFYTNAVCRSVESDGTDMLLLTHPGSANVGYTPKGDFNDRFLSFQCLKSTSPKKGGL